MTTLTAADFNPEGDFSNFFLGGLIVLAVFLVGFALWKAYEYLRDRMAERSDAEPIQIENTKDQWEQAISRPDGDLNYASLIGESDLGGLGGMTRREQEILFSTYAPREVRKEMKQRLRARDEKNRGRG
jgi:hypothetical protein